MKNKLLFIGLIAGILLMATGCTPNSITQSNTPNPKTTPGAPTPTGEISVPGFNIQLYIPGPNPLVNKSEGVSSTASTLLVIWHGIISPVTLVISFINPNMQMYEVHNDGSKYNLGFLIGVAIVFLILGAMLGSRRR